MSSMAAQRPVKRKIQTTVVVDESKRTRVDTSRPETTFDSAPQGTPSRHQAPAHQTLQNTIDVHLDEHATPTNLKISTIQAQNFVGNTTQRSSKIRALGRGKSIVWSTSCGSHIAHVAANRDWVVLVTANAELLVYATLSGAFHMSFYLERPVNKLMLTDKMCGVQNYHLQFIIWNLAHKSCIGTYKAPVLLQKNVENIAKCFLSTNGLPIVLMTTGELWYYSKRLSAWQQIETGINVMASLNYYLDFIQKTVPTGLISNIVLNKKQLKPVTLGSAQVAELSEEEHLERLLCALEELHSPDEYALLTSVYLSRLVSRGKVQRLFSYLKTLDDIQPDSGIATELIREEINKQLTNYPHIQQELSKLTTAQSDDAAYEMEDLGFLENV